MKRRTKPLDARPFVKWVGGKRRLIGELMRRAPIDDDTVTAYAEPFVGGGAMLFHVLSTYEPKKVYVSDLNGPLITAYEVVRDHVDRLVDQLRQLEDLYDPLSPDDRKSFFFKRREEFNMIVRNGGDVVRQTALMIFLNRTCYNGLYRVNSLGEFNVPHGTYAHPAICNVQLMRACSAALADVDIVCTDYHDVLRHANAETFVYVDPPYLPIKETSFTSYTEAKFGVDDQRELANVARQLVDMGAKVMLSNSDRREFLEPLYEGFSITEVSSAHVVGRNASSRVPLHELIITSYPIKEGSGDE